MSFCSSLACAHTRGPPHAGPEGAWRWPVLFFSGIPRATRLLPGYQCACFLVPEVVFDMRTTAGRRNNSGLYGLCAEFFLFAEFFFLLKKDGKKNILHVYDTTIDSCSGSRMHGDRDSSLTCKTAPPDSSGW